MTDPCAGGSTARTAGEAMLVAPKTCGLATTTGQAYSFFGDDHVHALLVVDGVRLVAVVERTDLDGPADALVHPLGRLDGRTVPPSELVEVVATRLRAEGRRRTAVVDADGGLLGLLCLKRSGRGFCTDADVAARAAERTLLPV